MSGSVLFFGCHDGPGHCMWRPGWIYQIVDGETTNMYDDGFAPRTIGVGGLTTYRNGHPRDWDRRVAPLVREAEQGRYLLHSWRGSTVMAWWDRCQGDTRPGSNSALIVPGTRTAEEMIAALAEHFPTVLGNLARAGVELREVGS